MMVVPFEFSSSWFAQHEALCVGKRRFQACVVCNSPARDVERRAVIRAGADERQAQRDVHAFFQPEILHRDQPLIVVLGYDNIESTLTCLHEDRIARIRAGGIDALGSGRVDCRSDDPDLLVPEEAAFTCVRVETRYGDTRGREAESFSTLMGKPDGGYLSVEIALFDRFAQRRVDRDEHRADVVVRKHHRHALGAAVVGQNFRMAGVADSRAGHRLFVDRRRDDAAHFSGLRCCDRRNDGIEGRLPGDRADLPDGWRLGNPGGLDDFNCLRLELGRIGCIDASHLDVQPEPAHDVLHDDMAAEHDDAFAALRKHLRHDLRPNAGGVAHREGKRGEMFFTVNPFEGWVAPRIRATARCQSVVTAKATGLHGEQERASIAKPGATKRESGIEFLQDLELTDVEKVQDRFHRVAAGGDQRAEAWALEALALRLLQCGAAPLPSPARAPLVRAAA